MPSLARILLPVDFSERSLGATRYAAPLVSRFGSEVTLLHVLGPPAYQLGETEIAGSMLAGLYRDRLEQALRELHRLPVPFPARRLVLEGDPGQQIAQFARDESIDLILMPTHGLGTFRPLLLGSNTAKTLHDADCPVWTGVHIADAPPLGASPFEHVLCAVDLGPQSGHAFAWAAWFAGKVGARLTILHASSGPSSAAAALAELRQLAEERAPDACIVLTPGDPAGVIQATAAERHADLLVIARGSAAGVYGRLRANAYAIIRQSPCPVVSV